MSTTNPIIEVNKRLSIQRDNRGGWMIHESREGINPKTKEPTTSTKTTYHATLAHAFNSIIDRESGLAESLNEIVDYVDGAKEDIAVTIRTLSLD